jgi:hypothetical protein
MCVEQLFQRIGFYQQDAPHHQHAPSKSSAVMLPVRGQDHVPASMWCGFARDGVNNNNNQSL